MPNSEKLLVERLLEIHDLDFARPAVWAKGEMLSYRELFERAGHLAAAMQDRAGVLRGDRVAILANRTPTAYVSILATLLAGAVYVPLNPRFPIERNKKILAQSASKLLIVDNRNFQSVAALADELKFVLTLDESEVPAWGACTHIPVSTADGSIPLDRFKSHAKDSRPGDLVYVLFTSGSSGTPKGVPINQRNLLAYVDNVSALVGLCANDRNIQLADFTFDISVHDIFSSWLNGAALYSVPENAALMASRFVEEHKLTGWFSVPSTAGQLKQASMLTAGSLASLRFTLFCGEALAGTIAESWALAAPESSIYNLYGPTEATVAFGGFKYVPHQAEPPAIVALGEPFPGQRMALFDEAGVRCRAGEAGEICLSGTQVCEGYWNSSELTASRFFESENERWYRTGDIGRYDAKTGFAFVGRVDQQLKIRGFRVELLEIEGVVRAASGRDIVAVVPWPLSAQGEATGCVAFVEGTREQEQAILSICRAKLADYMVPARVVFTAEIPKNANGKVDYLKLKGFLANGGKT